MRQTRLIYVENDSALRRILGEMLQRSKDLEVLGVYSNSNEVLKEKSVMKADVALIDFSLDDNGLNGIELGIALRNINEHLSIVIYSQFSVSKMVHRVPIAMRSGWSFFDKSAEMGVVDYVEIIKSTSAGKGNWETVSSDLSKSSDAQTLAHFQLTPRQRVIMALSVQGKSPKEIALELNLTYPNVRKELSRAYSVLLPDVEESENLKARAVLKYLEYMKI